MITCLEIWGPNFESPKSGVSCLSLYAADVAEWCAYRFTHTCWNLMWACSGGEQWWSNIEPNFRRQSKLNEKLRNLVIGRTPISLNPPQDQRCWNRLHWKNSNSMPVVGESVSQSLRTRQFTWSHPIILCLSPIMLICLCINWGFRLLVFSFSSILVDLNLNPWSAPKNVPD